jgi:hypothetical protein
VAFDAAWAERVPGVVDKLSLTWLGVRKTLTPEQRTTAARAFHADRELLSARRHQLDRRRDQIVLQAGVALGRAARSGRPERRARGNEYDQPDVAATPRALQWKLVPHPRHQFRLQFLAGAYERA